MTCINCNHYCGFMKKDIDYVKCSYWNEIEFRASVDTKIFVCPKENDPTIDEFQGLQLYLQISFALFIKQDKDWEVFLSYIAICDNFLYILKTDHTPLKKLF